MLVSKIYIYLHVSIPGDLWHFFCFDLCPKILLYRRFSYSVFAYIFERASTSDGVPCSVFFKPLYCTPSDVFASRNM